MRPLCRLALLIALAAVPAAAMAAPVTIVLDDFAYPAWGVRWTTLEFSKYTPPQMTAVEAGGAAARVELPAGGRMVLTTQQESKDWDGIRGKLPWPLPGTPQRLHLRTTIGGSEPVTIAFLVRDREGQQARTQPVTLQPGDQPQDVEAAVAAMQGPVHFVGIELSRGGREGTEPQPVLLHRLAVTSDEVEETLFVAAGRTSYDQAPVAGQPVELRVRAQRADPQGEPIRVRATVTRRYAAQGAEGQHQPVPADLSGQVPADGSAPLVLQWTPPEPGIYDVTFEFAGVQPAQYLLLDRESRTGRERRPVPATVEVVAYHDTFSDGEPAQANLERIQAAAGQDAAVKVYRTNLSPAVLVHANTPAPLKLFDGIQAQGLAVPQYVAVPEAGGVKVYRAAEASFAAMSEPWLVFFAGDARGWGDIRIKTRNRSMPAPIDVPWLVVLQRRPQGLQAQESGLILQTGGPQYVAIMPLRGTRTFEPTRTAQWASQGMPAEQAQHASAWARRLQRYPVYVQEDFRVDPAADTVTVRQQFTYLDLGGNEWNAPLAPYAPVSPMLAMAQQQRFPVVFRTVDGQERPVADLGVVSAVGPVSGIDGANDYEYRISGMMKYINEDRRPVLEGGGPLAEQVREMIRTQTPGEGEPETPTSRWTPGLTLREDYGIAMVGNSERHGLLGATIPYVDEDEALWRKRTLLVDALFLVNPHNTYAMQNERTGRIYDMEGMAWGRFRGWVDNNAYTADILRALGYYAAYTGDLELIRRHWPNLRAKFAVVCDFQRHGEWELSCFDTGGGDTWDSVCNGVIGFARLASLVGDDESYRYAAYYFAKRAATLPGHRQTNEYVAQQPYWPALLDEAILTPEGIIAEYSLDLPRAVEPVATLQDIVFSDVWGENYGLRPWNETVWMRGAREEYRMCKDLTPEYGEYWLVGQVQRFAPEWYERAIVQRQDPSGTVDRRTNEQVRPTQGAYVGKVNVQARAIVLGETLEQLLPLLELREYGVWVGASMGRVPRIPTYVALLEDGTDNPWVQMYGQGVAASDDWERGRDAYMDLGDENYVMGTAVGENGIRQSWAVWIAPEAERGLSFGTFGPATPLRDIRQQGLSWNTTFWAAGAGGQ